MVLCSFSSLPCNLLFTNQAGGEPYNPCDNYYSDEALMCYLQSIPLPALMRLELDAPIILDELREAASSFRTCKTPGDAGFPMEVYTQYGEVILTKLL